MLRQRCSCQHPLLGSGWGVWERTLRAPHDCMLWQRCLCQHALRIGGLGGLVGCWEAGQHRLHKRVWRHAGGTWSLTWVGAHRLSLGWPSWQRARAVPERSGHGRQAKGDHKQRADRTRTSPVRAVANMPMLHVPLRQLTTPHAFSHPWQSCPWVWEPRPPECQHQSGRAEWLGCATGGC